MKYVYLKMRDKARPKKAVASFFFNARGEPLERTIVGMYRSILLQLLECYPDLQTILDHSEFPPTHRPNAIHSLDVLKELLSKAILMLGQRLFTCFIDALDECDEQQVLDMIQFFEEMTEKSTTQQIPLRICFSSRHYPYIIIRWGSRLVLEHQRGHSDDLEAYVCSTLRAKEPEVIEKLLQKAAGVFMWVALVVEILNKEYARGAMFIHQRLEELPSNLSDLFRDIIRRDNENMNELLLCFLWILCAQRPLRPEEFYHALWSGLLPQNGSSHVRAPDTSIQDISDNLSRTHRYVISSSKGLAEVTGSNSDKKTVQFIHESVRDFLIKDKGLYELWPELGLDWESPSHEKLKHCCNVYLNWAYERGSALKRTNCSTTKHPSYAYIKRKGDMNPIPRYEYGEEGDLNKIHFLEYACQNIFYHANAASRTFRQNQFLSSFDLQSWIGVHNLFEKYPVRYYTATANIVYVLADKGHPELIRTALKRNPQIQIYGERYFYPLFAALARGDKESVAALLDLPSTIHEGVDLMEGFGKRKDLEDYKGKTPVSWAIRGNRTGIAKLLIRRGIHPDDMNRHLREASEHGNETIARILLQQGADPNQFHAKDTPLKWAIRHEHEEILKLLVDKGADVNTFGPDSHANPLCQACEAGNEAMIRILLGKDADVNVTDESGRTPIHCAIQRGYHTIVTLLLGHGSDVNIADKTGRTPLHKASERDAEALVKLLLDYGADVNASDHFGLTPLHYAYGYATAKLLIDYGSNVNASDDRGRIPPFILLAKYFLKSVFSTLA